MILKKIKNKNILTYGENKNADYQIKKIKYKSNKQFLICYSKIKKKK